MQKETQEYQEIKDYLLGKTASESARESVETKLMLDLEYYQNTLSIEEELIQHYADGKLSASEKQAFETHFLISDDRRDKVKFAGTFRSYLNTLKALERPQPKKKFSFAALFSFPMLRVPATAAATVLLLFSVFLGWNFYKNYSNSEYASATFNEAYRDGNPFGSRLSGLDSPPSTRERGGEEPKANTNAFREAASQIVKNAYQNATATNLILAAELYMTEKKFDEAVKQLERARSLEPDNSDIYNDLGVAYLEQWLLQEKGNKDLTLINNALENFKTAIDKKPDMLKALYNKARCLDAMPFSSSYPAKEAWEEYLRHDSTSPWSDEAKKRLEELNAQPSSSMSSDQRQQSFLKAVNENNEGEAFRLASQNRELITQNYLPQKLAMSFLEAKGNEKEELLRGLKYLGDLEKNKKGDTFAYDLAGYYADLSEEKTQILKNAQASVREGYLLCSKSDNFYQATQKFITARDLFVKAGDNIEAKTIGTYFVAYGFYSEKPSDEVMEMFHQVNEFSNQKNYKWFSLMNRDWVIGGQASLGYLLPAEVDDQYQAALKEAEEMGDVLMKQKFLCSLVERDQSVSKQDKNTFGYLQEIFQYTRDPNVSVRQKARGFDAAITALAPRLKALSKAIVRENIEFRENEKDPLFVIRAQRNAGAVYTKNNDLPEAEKWLGEAKNSAEELGEEIQRQKTLIGILRDLGNLESAKQNYPQAINYYDRSLQIQQEIRSFKTLYETKKLKLFAYQALGDDPAIERELPEILSFAEEKRKNITNEQERNSFFNNEQEVYDVAIGHAFRYSNAEQAFDYAETSNSRSLLGQLQNDANTPAGGGAPLNIGQIRERMPANVQLLQYAVLKDRVLIWIISRDKFALVYSEADSGSLKKKVEQYISKIRSKDRTQQEEAQGLSQELYGLLINPALQHLDRNLETCIVPNKVLFDLPFNALMSPAGEYFIREFTSFYSPSANVFILSTEQARRRNRPGIESLLSIGNPAFDRAKLPSDMRDLPDLPESAREAKDIAANYAVNYYQPDILVNGQATENAFRRHMGNSDVIHFAGHYLVHPESPMFSELVMAKSPDKEDDNFLTNSELMKERLPRTKLVVLSACRTAAEGYYDGEGSIGLSRTFLALGVPLVVASQWPVETYATSELMRKFHWYRKQGKLSTVRALHNAQLDMVNSPNEELKSPYYWAAFATFGGYAEF